MNFMEQGVALLRGGRFHEALQQFAQALREQPLSPEPRIGLSQACTGIGDSWAAASWLSDACRVAPQRPELWHGLAVQLVQSQRHAELEPLLQIALGLHPENFDLLQAQADSYLRAKQYSLALHGYEKLHRLQPDHPAILMHYGYCLEQAGGVRDPIEWYRAAIKHRSDMMEAHVNLAGVLWRVGDFDGALAHATRAVELAPAHPYAIRILGTALLNLNRLEEADAHLRRALELLPGFAIAEMDLAFCLLLAGKMEEGWVLYGRRWHDADRIKRPGFHQPQLEWKGPAREPLAGKRILVYAEQGLGDVIQFIRYLPMLQEQGATVGCVIQPELVDLVEHSMPGIHCVRPGTEFRTDHIVALMDLPIHFATKLESVPAQVPYLRAPDGKVEEWKAIMASRDPGKRKRVGLAWSGSLEQVNNLNRAMPLSELMPLIELETVRAFSLQKGDAGELTNVKPDPEKLVDLAPEWKDFTDSAAMMRNLDLVITVDTAVAHLAGALGVPVWVMLAPNADWRWLLDRDDSPWYPGMRLFRRATGEERRDQVERVMKELQQWAKPPNRQSVRGPA